MLCQTVFVIRTGRFVLSPMYGELMLVPTWELGVVLDRGHNEILVVWAVFFRKLENRRTVINLGFYQQLQAIPACY